MAANSRRTVLPGEDERRLAEVLLGPANREGARAAADEHEHAYDRQTRTQKSH